ncbi:MAG: 2-oxoacid:acceptor oxidoreductase subunit alpha, partial [Gemmatimonadales bacterium]
VDKGAFTERNLAKAGYSANPLDGDSLARYQVLKLDITKQTLEAVKPFGLGQKDGLRCRNMWALGLMLWMYGRERQATIEGLAKKFGKRKEIADANIACVNAGHAFGETAELSREVHSFTVPKAVAPPGLYRTINGTDAIAFGLVAGVQAAGIEQLMFSGYPITPASALLHQLASLKQYGVVTFQAEDEIAAICAAIGASWTGSLGVTSSSGPGVALKSEALGLAIATELPLVLVNSQRAGPSTGMPTKTEQSDLFQSVYGRNGDAPLPVIAAATPADGFDVAIEAVRLAVTYMTPVILLTDGFLANAAEPWLMPDASTLPKFPIKYRTDPVGFHPFLRDPKTLARVWARPGTPGLEHRIGGIERSNESGHISYDPDNHQKMTKIRAGKIAGIANDIPLQRVVLGGPKGKLALVGWGSTYGPIQQAVRMARAEGLDVSHIHLRYIHPFPRNLGDLLKGFGKVLVPEMNNGQLVTVLRSTYLIPAEGLSKINGKPFKSSEILDAIRSQLGAA